MYTIENKTLTDIADAIREKTGKSGLIKPEDMAGEIEGIKPNLQSKTATTNGTVTADSGYDGLSSVVVDVSGGGAHTAWYGVNAPDNAIGSDGDAYILENENASHQLPEGYTELRYIGTTGLGSTYVDTGYVLKPESVIEVGYSVASNTATNGSYLFGTRYNAQSSSKPAGGVEFLASYNSASNIINGNRSYTVTEINKYNTYSKLTIANNAITIVNQSGTWTVATTQRTADAIAPLILFGLSGYGTTTSPIMRLYYFRVRENDVLTLDIVPVLDDNGAPKLYDTVSQTTFIFGGTPTLEYLDRKQYVNAYVKINGVWTLLEET